MPFSAEYPPPEAWDALHTGECATLAEEFLGHPIDPYGRFAVATIIPLRDSWAASDRTVFCGIGGAATDGSMPLISEDVLTADHAYRWQPGECLTWASGMAASVPCDQPHEREVAGLVDFGDLAAPPTDADFDQRCTEIIDAYLGTAVAPQWGYSWDGLAPESWAAGLRTSHCLVAQLDGAGGEVAMTAPIHG